MEHDTVSARVLGGYGISPERCKSDNKLALLEEKGRNMSKYLDKAKEIRAITEPHYNCAQSVIVPFAEEAGIDEETAMRMGANFGSGMRIASVCGSFTGGLMTLGLFGVDDPKVVVDFANRIKEKHEGYLDCKDLLRINHEKGLPKKPHCDEMVYDSVAIVEEILRERGKIS